MGHQRCFCLSLGDLSILVRSLNCGYHPSSRASQGCQFHRVFHVPGGELKQFHHQQRGG